MAKYNNDDYKSELKVMVAVYPIIKHFILSFLTKIKRRLTLEQAYFDPWRFKFSIILHSSLFLKVFVTCYHNIQN